LRLESQLDTFVDRKDSSMSSLWVFTVISLLVTQCQSLDTDQKEFIVDTLKTKSNEAKNGQNIPANALEMLNLDIIPEDHKQTKEELKLLGKPTVVVHKDGKITFVDTKKGEEVELLSSDGIIQEGVLNQIFNPDFINNAEEMLKKKEHIVHHIKLMRKDAMVSEDIIEKISDRQFTFFNDGSVLVEKVVVDKKELIRRFNSEEDIGLEIIDTIFPEEVIASLHIEDRPRAVPTPTSAGEIIHMWYNVVMSLLAMYLVLQI